MASIEEICNEALGLIGENPITSIDDRETKAIRCHQFFATTRDACLRVHEWSFATRRVQLARLNVAPSFGFAYAYEFPQDCLRLLEVSDAVTDPYERREPVKYRLEGQKILSSIEEMFITYISQVDETGLFDALFVSYLAAELAAKLGASLTRGATIVNSMIQLAEARRQIAVGADNRESNRQPKPIRSTWKDAR